MSSRYSGSLNGNWKGGRVIDPRGYVLIMVGKDHPLADCRGYAYEHRLHAAKKMHRDLAPGEITHHRDHDKGNNAPDNLDLKPSRAHHAVEHRSETNRFRLRMPGQSNIDVECECGCGETFQKFDGEGRPRRFRPGHNMYRQGNRNG